MNEDFITTLAGCKTLIRHQYVAFFQVTPILTLNRNSRIGISVSGMKRVSVPKLHDINGPAVGIIGQGLSAQTKTSRSTLAHPLPVQPLVQGMSTSR